MNDWTAHVAAIAPTVIGRDFGDQFDDQIDAWLERPGAVATIGHGRIEGTFTAYGATIEAAAAYAVAAIRESFGDVIDEIIAVEVATHDEADRRSDALIAEN